MLNEIITEIKQGYEFQKKETFLDCTRAIAWLNNEKREYRVHGLEAGAITAKQFTKISTVIDSMVNKLEEKQANIWKAYKGEK